jgi:shikimate dehydrogenase
MESSIQDIYAIFGRPIGHSLSPLMHNAAYREMGIRACYIPFEVSDLPDAVKGMKALGIKGASITIPFKTDIISLLDAVDENARAMGAVNTVINRNGYLSGTNTDWIGLSLALKAHYMITGKTFAILGSGGAARAAVFAVLQGGGKPVIVFRTEERAKHLAESFNCRMIPFEKLGELEADCLINVTPVGMYPEIGDSPVNENILSRFRWVMDTIYNPLETKLLVDARKAGCKTISGLDMFVHQGAEQIKFWTNLEPPRSLMRRVVAENLKQDVNS